MDFSTRGEAMIQQEDSQSVWLWCPHCGTTHTIKVKPRPKKNKEDYIPMPDYTTGHWGG